NFERKTIDWIDSRSFHVEIIKQINGESYLAIIADETTDISGKTQVVTIFRYVFNGEPVERLWNYMNPENVTLVLSQDIFERRRSIKRKFL
ncbi:unnamed protein product, partial [Acanthoscelides obtectus]